MKNSDFHSDESILEAILGSVEARNKVFAYLYKSSGWRQVTGQMVQNSGYNLDQDDVFQECVIILDKQVRNGLILQTSSLKTYFFGIVKQYMFNRNKAMKYYTDIDEISNMASEINIEFLKLQSEKSQILNLLINELGQPCKEILSLFKLSFSNEEIARKLNLSSPEMAKKYSYRCRNRLRDLIFSRPEILSYLKD